MQEKKLVLDIKRTLIKRHYITRLRNLISSCDEADFNVEKVARYVSSLQEQKPQKLVVRGALWALADLKQEFGKNIFVVTRCKNDDEEIAKRVLLDIIGFWSALGISELDHFIRVDTREQKADFIESYGITHIADDHGDVHRIIKSRGLRLSQIWINPNPKYSWMYPEVFADLTIPRPRDWRDGISMLLA